MRRRIHRRRTLALSVAVGLIGLVGTSSAGAATQLGQTFAPTGSCGANETAVQSTSPGSSYAAPSPGVITSWSFQANASPPLLKLKVARAAGGNNFTIVGESLAQVPAPSAVSTFPTRISVEAGDILGMTTTTGGNCAAAPVPGYAHHGGAGDPAPGTTVSFPFSAPVQFDIAASLEPDCDSDGFGDESQDQVVDCVTPETQITKGPKNKTKKKTATFEFTSTEPGSTFQCSFDGDPLTPCTSPESEKVGKGKHEFDVVAVDPAGNQDATPATASWKVKKK